MNYFKDTHGTVYAYEADGSQDHLIGDKVALTEAELAAHLAPPAPFIPTSVTMRQARLALLGAGLLSQVDAALAAIADPVQRQAAQIDWEYAATVDRGSDLVVELASALNLDAAALDALFSAAGAL